MVQAAALLLLLLGFCRASEQSDEAAFFDWLSKGGASNVEGFSLQDFPTEGMGLQIDRAINGSDETIFTIPRSLVMSSVKGLNRWPRAQTDIGDPCQILMMYLADEKLKGSKSEFAPYIKVLPEDVPTPVLWPGAPGYRKKPGNLGPALTIMSQSASSWSALQFKYNGYHEFLEKAISFIDLQKYPGTTVADLAELLAWSHAIISSRAKQFGKHKCDLVPLIDMLNHKGEDFEVVDLGALKKAKSDGSVTLQSTAARAAGAQLFRDYNEPEGAGAGPPMQCGIESLWTFGFIADSAASSLDCFFMDVNTNLDDNGFAGNQDPNKSRKRKLLEAGSVPFAHSFIVGADGRLPPAAVPLLRVTAASNSDLDILDERAKDADQEAVDGTVKGSERLISLSNEVRMLRQLGAAVSALEGRFGDDKELQLMVDRSARKMKTKMADERAKVGPKRFDEHLQQGVLSAHAVRAGERRVLEQMGGQVNGLWLGFLKDAVFSPDAMSAVGPIMLILFFWFQSQSAAKAVAKVPVAEKGSSRMPSKTQRGQKKQR
jgi:hypothetical protein